MKKTVLYFYPSPSTFIIRDFEIIEKHYNLITYLFQPVSGFSLIKSFALQFIFLLKNISHTDIIVCHFMGYHSFLPTLLGKLFSIPRLSIVAGTECHSYPSIGYGSFRKPVYAWFTRISFLNSSYIAPVHESLMLCDDTYYALDFPKQGYKYFIPEIDIPFSPLYYGYNSEEFKPVEGSKKQPNTFLTVAGTLSGGEFYRKGIDLVIEAAKTFPEYQFTIISTPHADVPDLPNLKLVRTMPVHELLPYFSSHEFYFQLSIAEGFPNALCEAMACECIPIGSAVFAIPLIIGDTGFVLQKKDFNQLKTLILKAVGSDKKSLAKSARVRIKNEFPQERREKEFIKLIEHLVTSYS